MSNDVEIHVSWKDDGGKALGDLKAKAKRAGGDAGDEWSGSFSGKLGKAAPAKIKVDVDDRLAKAKVAELGAKKNAVVVAFDADVAKAEARIADLEAKRGKTKIDVDAEIAKAKAKIDALTATKNRALIQLDADTEPAVRKVRKATEDVEKATEKVAQRTQAKFGAMQFAAAFAGLPAAAIAASVIAGGALAAVPLAAAAGAALLIHSNQQVNDSFVELGNHAQEMATRAAQPMKGYLVTAIQEVDKAAQAAEPQLTTLFAASGPPMLTFTSGMIKLVGNVMPGLITAAQNSQGPMRGLESLLSDTGAGVSEFFTNASKGAAGAEAGLVSTGGIIRDLTGFAGTLMANLANGASSALPQFRAALGQVEGVVLSLSSSGMPALTGATSGFLHTVGGALGVVQGFAGMLGSWAQPLGSLGGSLFATNKLAGMFGTSLGQTGFGLKAFSGSVDEAGNKTTPFKTALAAAEKDGTSKFKAGLNSVVSNGLNPLGIVLGVGSILLDAYGQSQQKAAEYAAAHRDNVRQLTDAVRADNGAMGENTQQANAKALADKNASSNLAVFGQTVQTASEAIKGNGYAYDALKYSAGATLATIADGAGITGDHRDALIKLGATSLDTGKNFDQLKNEVLATGITYDSSGESAQRLTDAQQAQIEALINGTGAVGEQVRATRESHDAYIQAEQALTGLNRAQIENRDATMQATQAIYDQQNAQLGYRGAVLSSKEAIATFEKTSKSGTATEDQKAAALLKVEQAFANQESAAYKAAYANSTATLESGKLNDAITAQNRETVNLANTFQGVLPQSVAQTIGKFNATQAVAAGLTIAIDGTGHAVYRLPNGKFIAISSSAAEEAARIEYFQHKIDILHGKTVTVTTSFVDVTSPTNLTGRRQMFAKGGLVGYASGGTVSSVPRFDSGGSSLDVGPGGLLRGRGTGTSDSIMARVSNGEFVVRASQTEKHLPLLQAINEGRDGFAAGGMVKYGDVSQSAWDGLYASGWRGNPGDGMEALYAPSARSGGGVASGLRRSAVAGQGGGAVTVHIDLSGGDQNFMEWLRNRIRVDGGGDVQVALGRS